MIGSTLRCALLSLCVFSLLTASAHATGISATATYTGVADATTAGIYDYSLTLKNTGTTTIGTFWFAWVPGAGFLSATPASISSPTNWSFTSTNMGKGIRWTSTTSLLQPGQSLTGFNFNSTETPTELLGLVPGTGPGAGDTVTTSYVYIAAPLADPGALIVPTAAAPEPGTILLTLTGLSFAATNIRSRLRRA